MMKNKLLLIMVVLLVVIAIIGSAAIFYIYQTSHKDEQEGRTIEEVLKTSVDVNDVTTNLASDDIIRISFKIQTENKAAKEELEKRDFQVKNIIILSLSEKTEDDIKGKDGQVKLEEELKEKISSIMQKGKVEKVYITESLLQ